MKIKNTLISTVIGDITKVDYVDAIVNPTNSTMTAHSGLNKEIHQAAGDELRKACEKLGQCKVGEAKATDAYNLPCKYIIHTVGPTWQDGKQGEKELLGACYQNVLETAKGLHIRTIGFSSIATGIRGFPTEEAAEIAVKVAAGFVRDNPQSFDKIIWILRGEETKKAYDEEINECEVIEEIKDNVRLASIPLRAINWDDIIIYGSVTENASLHKTGKMVRGLVRYIELSGKVTTVMIPGVCIEAGSWIYAEKTAIEELQHKGVLMCRTILQDDSTGMKLPKEVHAGYSQLMRQHGYIITNRVVPTDMQRKTILAMMIKHNNIPLKDLIQHLIHSKYEHSHLGVKVQVKIKKDFDYVRELV